MSLNSQLSVLMFTDIVDSVRLLEKYGVNAYSGVLRRHNAVFEEQCREFRGTIWKSTGDGYLATFPTVVLAVRAALVFQHALRAEPWGEVRLTARVGLHVGEFASIEVSGREDVVGHSANLTARLMSLAVGGQVLLTRMAFDEGRQFVAEHPPLPDGAPPPALSWVAHGPYCFKGTESQPIEVFEVGAEGLAPLVPPPNSEKVWRQTAQSVDPLKDWRAAAGVAVPGRAGWAIECKLGEGGFGEVWLAVHRQTRQRRVFKFCYDAERLRSLKREFIISRVIRTLGERDDIGVIDEVRLDQPPFFLESEWSAEGSIIQWVEKAGGIGALPLETRLEIVVGTARALAAAHSVGILHKDIKPGNILMHLVAGRPRPRLVDFGIGTVMDAAKLAQMTISMPTQEDLHSSGTSGTLLYLPPEVLEGGEWTTQGDLYSLGVVLYQIVVGDSPTATWYKRAVAYGWERDVSDELLREDIALCVDREPARRIQSAADLAERLERLPQRRAELAEQLREIQEEEEAQRRQEAERKKAEQNEVKLRRTRAHLMRGALLGALAVCGLLTWGFQKKDTLLKVQDELAEEREQGAKDEKLARLAARFSEKALLHLEDNDPAAAALWFTEALTRRSGNASAEDDADRRRIACALRAMPRLLGASIHERMTYLEPGPQGDCAFLSSRGEEAAAAGAVTARGGQALLWFFDGRGTVALDYPTPPEPASFVRAAFDAAGQHVAAVTDTGWLFLWSVAEGGLDPRPPLLAHLFDGPLSDVGFHPSRPELLLVTTSNRAPPAEKASGEAIVFDWKAKSKVASLWHNLPINRALFAPGGAAIATAAGDPDRGGGECKFWSWDPKEKGPEPKTFIHAAAVNWLDFSPDGTLLLTASGTQNASTGEAQIWNLKKLWPAVPPFRHGGAVLMAEFDSSGGRIVTASQREGVARIWQSGNPAFPLLILAHDGNVFAARWSADDRFVVTGSRDQTARVWDAASGALAAPIMHHGGTVNHVRFAAHDRYLLSLTIGVARLWDLAARQPDLAPVHGAGSEKVAAASPDGRWLALASEPDLLQQMTEIRVAETATGKLRGALFQVAGTVHHLAFSPDAATLAIAIQYRPTSAGEKRGEVRLHDFATPDAPDVHLIHDGIPTFIAFAGGQSPRLLTLSKENAGSPAKRVHVWGRAKGALEREFSQPEMLPIDCAAISPDGSLIATGGGSTQPRKGVAPIFSVDTGDTIGIAKHDEAVRAIAFDRAGARLATGAVDDEVRVWNVRDCREPVARFKHTADLTSVAFVGDGSRLLSTSADTTAALWDVAKVRQLGAGRHRAVVRSAAASADGKYLVTGGDDRTVRVWDAATFRPIAIFPQSAQLETVGFTPGDARVFSLGFASPEAATALPAGAQLDSVETPARRAEFRLWDFSTDPRSIAELQNDSLRLAAREVPRVDEPGALDRLHSSRWAAALPPPGDARIHAPPDLADYHQREHAHAMGAGFWRAAAWQADARTGCLHPAFAEDHLASASAHFETGHWEEVLSRCLQAGNANWHDPAGARELQRLRALASAELVLRERGSRLLARGLAELERGNQPGSVQPAASAAEAAHAGEDDAAWQGPLKGLRQAAIDYREDSFVLIKLAEYFARGGAWTDAERALIRACELERADPHGARPSAWQRLATLCLLPEPPQLVGYRAACDEILSRFRSAPNYGAIVAWPCLLNAHSASVPAEEIVGLARQAVAEAPTNFYRLNTLGAALVRNGNFEEAVERLDDARQFFNAATGGSHEPEIQGRSVDWIFLALAEHALGRPDRARHWLHLAETSAPAGAGTGELNKLRQTWNTFEAALLVREVKAVLEAPARPPGPP